MECNTIHCRQTALLIAFLTLFVTTALAQIPLAPGDIPGIEIIRSDTIKGKALWGLIDGGADIYFEYGFSNVTVQEILWENYRFKIEIYTMLSEEAAFGIFSVSHHKCNPDNLSKWCCRTPYQIQLATGNCYISVVNDSGTLSAQDLSRRISQRILEKVNREGLILPAIFSDTVLQAHVHRIKFISGPLGLQNGYPSWDEKFTSIEKYKAYILPIEFDTVFITISMITFSKAEDVQQFLLNVDTTDATSDKLWTNKIDGKQHYFKMINPKSILYLESDIPDSLLKPYIHTLKSDK